MSLDAVRAGFEAVTGENLYPANNTSSPAEVKNDNYFANALASKVESMTGKSLEEMQEEVTQRREAIDEALDNRDLDTAVDLYAEDGLIGKMFKHGWNTGKAIGEFFQNLFG